MEYPTPPDKLWRSDVSEMIVLIGLILMCMPRPRVAALHVGLPIMSEQRRAIAATPLRHLTHNRIPSPPSPC